nr:MAG TPA: hypothetical protein [Caudoviricetes sp.]
MTRAGEPGRAVRVRDRKAFAALRARAREETPIALEPQGIAALFSCPKVDGS